MDEEKTRILSADEVRTRILGGAAQSSRDLPAPRLDGDRIIFHCSAGHRLVVPASLAGKRGKCSKCGVPLQIPDLAQPEAAAGEWPEVAAAEPESPQSDEAPATQEAAAPPPPPEAAADGGPEADWNFIADIGEPPPPPAVAGFASEAWPGAALPGLPSEGDMGNPMARLLTRLWAEREHGGIIEIHLTGGSVILPEEFAARWSGGSHGLFASQAADGTVTLTAVAWDTVQRIVVRHLSAVPGDMFE